MAKKYLINKVDMSGYNSKTQTDKNIAWFLPRPKPDHYKGGKPLYCEEWLIQLGKDILGVDKPEILNLFCGMNKYGFRIDIKPESLEPKSYPCDESENWLSIYYVLVDTDE